TVLDLAGPLRTPALHMQASGDPAVLAAVMDQPGVSCRGKTTGARRRPAEAAGCGPGPCRTGPARHSRRRGRRELINHEDEVANAGQILARVAGASPTAS